MSAIALVVVKLLVVDPLPKRTSGSLSQHNKPRPVRSVHKFWVDKVF